MLPSEKAYLEGGMSNYVDPENRAAFEAMERITDYVELRTVKLNLHGGEGAVEARAIRQLTDHHHEKMKMMDF